MEKGMEQDQASERLLATGAMFSAIAASSCCVLPVLFVSVGISGAWIGTLIKLAPYQPIFLTLAVGSIAAGFWSTYRSKQVVCAGPECGNARSRWVTKILLWAGLIIVIVAASADWWAKLLT